MSASRCEEFRRAFEPGRRDPHRDTCAACRTWAAEVESWRALGAHAPLSAPLRHRLLRLPRPGCADLPAETLPPPIPLPQPLRARLVAISRAARSRRRVLKARYAVAASYLLAGLLSLATGGAAPTVPPAPTATREASRGVARASVRGTQLLLQFGDLIFEECERANRSAEALLDRLGSRAGRAQSTPDLQKEKTDGTRTAP